MKNEKKNIISIFIALFIIGGIVILLYPFLRFWLSERSESYAIQEYDARYAEIKESERREEWNRAVSYNEQLQPGAVEDPFSKSLLVSDSAYQSILNIGDDGMMGYIQIPKINLRLPVYHGTTEAVLEAGSGHMEGTHLPVGGAGTHAVLTGHTGLQSSVLFTNLTQLEENDEFYLTIMGEVLAYRIDQISVVLPTETEGLQAVDGEDYVTLVTCTPYGVNSHRLLVRGQRVPYTPEEIEEKIANTGSVIDWMTVVLIGVIALLIIKFWAKRYG